MGTWVTVQDVELEWNQEIPSDSVPHVNALIDKAERLVLETVPDVAARLTAGQLSLLTLGDVVGAMVLRVLRNPSGYRSETAGDYSYQADPQVGSGRLARTEQERRRLLGRLGSGRAYSMRLADPALEQLPQARYRSWRPNEWTVPATGEAP